MKTDYQKLKEIIDEIDDLIAQKVKSSDPNFQAWKTDAERFISNKYGIDSIEYENFSKTLFHPSVYIPSASLQYELIEVCKRGLEITKATFLKYLPEFEAENLPQHKVSTQQKSTYSKVFIVHGHDGELKESVARILEKLGISAIILSEQPNQGNTIIEKFEKYSDVSGAICLFTADDLGRKKADASDLPRARQNVVFETGFFMGKLGRDHIVILANSGVEIPSDLSGVVHTDTTGWELSLGKELKAMGYKIDFNKLI